MKITINGKQQSFTAPLNITACLEQQGFSGKLVAVAVNGEFVPRACYDETALRDGDDIEIVAPMQGG